MAPTPVARPELVKLNGGLAELLGLDPVELEAREWIDAFGGNRVPEGAQPLAMAYAGHQFGSFVPQLGDGRAILLGEVIGRDGIRRDVQLKGAGRTPFSRNGDGRAALGPVLREYIVSEAMTALGLPSTRSLAAVATGETVVRERLMAGAVLVRVAQSHVRIGTFQYFAARRDVASLKALADYVIGRHYPEAAETGQRYRTFLDQVIRRQAGLVARWLGVGFIHGVMNTDNMSIAGETIDYGPCAFMDAYHPERVFSSIDYQGRYAYGNQARIAHWNLMCLAQALLPLLGESDEVALAEGQAAIDGFSPVFEAEWLQVMRAKIGLQREEEDDGLLIQDLLTAMAEGKADFTLTFRHLAEVSGDGREGDHALRDLFATPEAFDGWACKWRERLGREASGDGARQNTMLAVNPAFIPRNHRVEAAIVAAYAGDFAPFHRLVEVLARPYDAQPEFAAYMDPPAAEEIVTETFCGT